MANNLSFEPMPKKIIQTSLDRLYLNSGYFYALYKLKNGQIEILLSAHPLSGFIEYKTPFLAKEVA